MRDLTCRVACSRSLDNYSARALPAVMRGPRDVILQNKINCAQKDRVREPDARLEPEAETGLGYTEIFAKLLASADDLRGAP